LAVQYQSKANLTDITDPLNPISLGGNLTLLITITDNSEPGSGGTADTIAISLYKQNALWFSNNWVTSPPPARTVELALAGGNLQVRGTALAAAAGEGPGGAPITPAALEETMDQAIASWQAAGVAPEQLAALGSVSVQMADIAGPYLGFASWDGIAIDVDAGGHGWDQIDLLTVVTHELGHLLGFEHEEGEGVLAASLPTGVRRLPAALEQDSRAPESEQPEHRPIDGAALHHEQFSGASLVLQSRPAFGPVAPAILPRPAAPGTRPQHPGGKAERGHRFWNWLQGLTPAASEEKNPASYSQQMVDVSFMEPQQGNLLDSILGEGVDIVPRALTVPER
jgi:hypothetical protein